jgi:hypothetical protein
VTTRLDRAEAELSALRRDNFAAIARARRDAKYKPIVPQKPIRIFEFTNVTEAMENDERTPDSTELERGTANHGYAVHGGRGNKGFGRQDHNARAGR